MSSIESETMEMLDDAYRSPDRQRELASRSACYLPLMGGRCAATRSLIEDDGVLNAMCEALGSEPIVKPAKASVFSGPSGWHRDCYSGLRGLKIISYFGSENATLLLVPGSHRESTSRILERALGTHDQLPWQQSSFDRVRRADIPVQSVQLQPREVFAFDIGLWHASTETGTRTQWSVSYLAMPGSSDDIDHLVAYLGQFLEKRLDYSGAEFPYFPPAWETSAAPNSRLERAMRISGVMDAYLDTFGTGR